MLSKFILVNKNLVFLLICRFYCFCSDAFEYQTSKSFLDVQLFVLSQLYIWLLCFKKWDVKHNLLLLLHINMHETISELGHYHCNRMMFGLFFKFVRKPYIQPTVKNITNIICSSHSCHCHDSHAPLNAYGEISMFDLHLQIRVALQMSLILQIENWMSSLSMSSRTRQMWFIHFKVLQVSWLFFFLVVQVS